MKPKVVFLIIALISFLSACDQDIDIGVDTLFIKNEDRETARKDALNELYKHYQKSTKNREAYEVVCKKNGRFILNFSPVLNFLTVCGDPGSGWSRQYQNVDETLLKRLVDEQISIEDLAGFGPRSSLIDSLLTRKSPIYRVNTNGSPSI
ncbi:hypothetical protein [Dyadobacter sp. CY323]|uniref:hypothetical protein n=1 Tax=Dyadobacter sp. CY323 TaxID=2907302 RepID=UPI001F446889|nr:hypothetical protein [Dyadobacter sp. CY323]MCE6992370.1 hypothetical protein [Dyadobacter sp. CY323]